MRLYTLILLGILVAHSGCGSRTDGEAVEGTVTYGGQPLSEAAITFFPQQGRPLTVPLDDRGTYSVRLPAGNYKVTIAVGATLPEGFKEGDPIPPPKIALPDVYTIRPRTQLSATVAEDQSEPIDFALK